MKTERVVENLNRGLHKLFAEDEQVFLIGEDLLDPYGGAFKVSRGLSTKYPDRILTTPLSEEGFIGVAGGLSLMGNKPIVEIMFGDFVALGFDQILNFASKSVTMYGRKLDLNLVVRCAVGGNRAYGATHSQSLQKHFIGIPNLELYELSPFDEAEELLRRLVNLGCPSILFEDKILYTQHVYRNGRVDDLFVYERIDANFVRVRSREFSDRASVILSPGATFARSLAAARKLFLEDEIETQIIVPSRLYPLSLEPVAGLLYEADQIVTVEEGVAGGTWGHEVLATLYGLWGHLPRGKIRTVCSKDSIIPSAPHLEKQVLVQTETIYHAVKVGVGDAIHRGPQAQQQ